MGYGEERRENIGKKGNENAEVGHEHICYRTSDKAEVRRKAEMECISTMIRKAKMLWFRHMIRRCEITR